MFERELAIRRSVRFGEHQREFRGREIGVGVIEAIAGLGHVLLMLSAVC